MDTNCKRENALPGQLWHNILAAYCKAIVMEDNRGDRNKNAPYNERATADTAGSIVSEYIVEERDTLEDVARMHGITIDEIIAANQETIQSPSDLVQAGQRIRIPKRR
jgi:LysM repeat protein